MYSSQKHPYYYYAALKALRDRTLHSDSERREAMTRVALNTGDLRAAAAYANLDNLDWQHFYPAVAPTEQVTTVSAIDTFLEQYGHQSPEEDALLERMIFNPTPEYQIDADRLDAAPPADAQDALIDSFMAKHPAAPAPSVSPAAGSDPAAAPAAGSDSAASDLDSDANEDSTYASTPAAPAPVQPAPSTPEDTTLSESLARIFIKQGQYERAFEIISSLNLKNPKKSVYFADQLRFLQKLIEIDRARNSARSGK